MAEQQRNNHTRHDPAFHYLLVPLLWFVLIASIVLWHCHADFAHGVAIAGATALMLTAMLTRVYALRNQDRIIRLEENLRLAAAGADGRGFSIKQLVALRFAGDAELAALALRAHAENLSPAQIKDAIQQWRADNTRI